jgi:dTDP-4-amino-4,6-dideoxygalactose transaminase
MKIPKWPVAGEREMELIRDVLESGQWGGFNGIVQRFEREFAAFQHCAYGVSAANGTVTLEMALEAIGIGPGDEVIVPAISFVSTATAVSRVGALPVFVDIEPYSFHIDPDRAAAAVTPRTKALMAVHFGGPVANMDRLSALGIPVIEDAAHSQGAEWRGQRAGSFGVAGSFSFQNGKVMTAGEGGILTTNDEEFAKRLRAIANTGRREGEGFFFHYTPGSNYRLTALQAAVLIAQLERLPGQNARRERYAGIVREQTAELAGLTWQQVPPEAKVHTNYLMLARIDAAQFGASRDEFHRCVTAAGIPCTPFYPHPLYGNPLYRAGGCRVEPCPVAEACVRDAFWFPHRLLLGSDDDARALASLLSRIAQPVATSI